MQPSVRDRRRVFTAVFFVLLSLLALSRAGYFYNQAFNGFAWDFAINRTAAQGWQACVSLEGVGVAILCALIAGPLTWDHYLAWGIIPVMLLAAHLRGWQCLLLLAVLSPMYFAVPYPKADEVAAHAVWRVLVMVQIAAIVVVAAWLAMKTKTSS